MYYIQMQVIFSLSLLIRFHLGWRKSQWEILLQKIFISLLIHSFILTIFRFFSSFYVPFYFQCNLRLFQMCSNCVRTSGDVLITTKIQPKTVQGANAKPNLILPMRAFMYETFIPGFLRVLLSSYFNLRLLFSYLIIVLVRSFDLGLLVYKWNVIWHSSEVQLMRKLFSKQINCLA